MSKPPLYEADNVHFLLYIVAQKVLLNWQNELRFSDFVLQKYAETSTVEDSSNTYILYGHFTHI